MKRTTAPYKYPRIVEFVDELPKTVGGKIKRRLIRQNDGLTIRLKRVSPCGLFARAPHPPQTPEPVFRA